MSASVSEVTRVPRIVRVTLSGALFVALVAAGCGGGDNPVNPPGGGRTIRFPGDAATLQAAVDMASRGDTVLVEAGTHVIDATVVFGDARDGVTLAGRLAASLKWSGAERPVLELASTSPESGIAVRAGAEDVTIRGLEIRGDIRIGVELLGPRARLVDCRIVGPSLYCVSCTQAHTTPAIEGNLLLAAGVFGVACADTADPTVIGNTIVGAGDCGILSTNAAPVCARNIVVGSANWGIACFGAPLPTLSCNALFDNVTDDYSLGCVPGTGDFHADPLFCDALTYALADSSPCAAANSTTCGQIGAVGVGCPAP